MQAGVPLYLALDGGFMRIGSQHLEKVKNQNGL